jgi:putative transposase
MPSPKQERIARLKATLCERVVALLESGQHPKMTVWQDTVELFNRGLFLPELRDLVGEKSERALRVWVNEYLVSGRDYFALARPNSAVAQGRRVTAVESAFIQKVMLHRNAPKIGSAITLLKAAEREKMLASPSCPRTIRRWWEDYERSNRAEVTLARHGSTYLQNVLLPSLRRDTSLVAVNDVWVADGHDLGFDVIDPVTGKAKRPCFIAWMDFKSRWIVGGELAFTEHSQHVYSALRNAILNAGGVPRVAYLDNGKAFKARLFTGKAAETDFEVEAPGIFAKLGMDSIFAWPYNARSKPIERAFQTMQEQLERFLSSWRGASVADKPADLNRNEKWIQNIFERKPLTLDEAKLAIQFWAWHIYANSQHKGLNGKTPREVWESGVIPEERRIEPSRLFYLMLSDQARTVGKEGVRLFGRLYWHRDLIPHVNERIVIRYDIEDIRQILVYDERDRYICTADLRDTVHAFVKLTGDPQSELDYQTQLREHRRLNQAIHRNTKQLLKDIPEIIPLTLHPGDEAPALCSPEKPKITQVVAQLSASQETEDEPEEAVEFDPGRFGIA